MIYQVKNLSFTYPGGNRKILDNISLSLEEGEILTILGPNGAGKTTLLNCMADLFTPDEGSLYVDGKNIKDINSKELAAIVAYVPQAHNPAFNYSVLDFVLMGRAPSIGFFSRPKKSDEEICMETLNKMGIDHLANKSYMEISGGERQQAMIARAVVQQPKVILFDEPTAHLDFGNQHRVLELVTNMAKDGFSIIITTHNPDHALLLGNKSAIVDKDGHILTGKSEEIITEENLKRVYKTDLKMIYVEQIHRTACLVPKI